MSDSYAGTYSLEYLRNGWATLYVKGRAVGSWRGRGGVYAAAVFFNV